jgi:hypothetical protein
MLGVPALSGGTLEEAGELRSAGTAEAAVATWVFRQIVRLVKNSAS